MVLKMMKNSLKTDLTEQIGTRPSAYSPVIAKQDMTGEDGGGGGDILFDSVLCYKMVFWTSSEPT